MQATTGLAAALHRLAEGDLSFELNEPFAPDFEALRHDLNRTIRQLDAAMSGVVQSSVAIDGGSQEISQSDRRCP
jgi:methyl-accepting chemotaxis protein